MVKKLRIKLGRWSIVTNFQIHTNAKLDHECLNGIMDGTYGCEYCYPSCKKCGRDTADFDVHCTSKECQDDRIIKTGNKFKITGYYKLTNHNYDCFVPQQAKNMFFKKGDTAPTIGSCYHIVDWQLIERYNPKNIKYSDGIMWF